MMGCQARPYGQQYTGGGMHVDAAVAAAGKACRETQRQGAHAPGRMPNATSRVAHSTSTRCTAGSLITSVHNGPVADRDKSET